jgi:hypothetical protein
MATRTPPQFQNIVQPTPPPRPTATLTSPTSNPVNSPDDWVKMDQAWKESQPQTVSNRGIGVSN